MNDLPELHQYVAGCFDPPEEELPGWLCEPASGVPLLRQRATAPATLERAVALATWAHEEGPWQSCGVPERIALLERIAEEMARQQAPLAALEARTVGLPIAQARMLAGLVPAIFRAAAAVLRDEDEEPTLARPGATPVAIRRLPRGPAAVIAPWNAPAVIASHKIASALAAGCPVLAKPSEWAPLSCVLLARAIARAGLPEGAFQLVHGDARTGAALVADPRVRAVSFTGGLAGGRAVAAACGRDIKPAQLELGGNNPLLVLAGAEVERAAAGVVETLTTLNGQWCRALGRLIVHERLLEPLLAAVHERLAALRLGDPLAEETAMGPLVSAPHLDSVRQQVRALLAAGGTAHHPTPLPPLPGHFLPPTLVTGVPVERATEEIFGPVATVHPVAGDDEALRAANAGPHGLAAYVYGQREHALAVGRRIRAGVVKINGADLLGLHPLAPRPAWGTSGLGEEGSRETIEFFRGLQVIGSHEVTSHA
jgi:phenylacetaldehyde dehydrogenase